MFESKRYQFTQAKNTEEIINLTYKSENIDGLINITILSYKFYVQESLGIFQSGYGKTNLELYADYLKTKHNLHCVLSFYQKSFDNLLFKCDMNIFFTDRPTREQLSKEHDNIINVVMDHFKIDYSILISFKN
jgi:hypothetical protein